MPQFPAGWLVADLHGRYGGANQCRHPVTASSYQLDRTAPDAVFTVRTYATTRPYEPDQCANPAAPARKPAGHSLALTRIPSR